MKSGRANGLRAGMRAGREDRRKQDGGGAGALGISDFGKRMGRDQAREWWTVGEPFRRSIHTIRAPSPGLPRCAGQVNGVTHPPRKPGYFGKAITPPRFGQVIMAEDYARSARQLPNLTGEPHIVARIGNQPDIWN